MMTPDTTPSPDRTAQLQNELAECVMSHSYMWCLAGVLLSIPLGVKTRSYAPLLLLGAGGTAIDILHGWSDCMQQREALAEHQRNLKEGGK